MSLMLKIWSRLLIERNFDNMRFKLLILIICLASLTGCASNTPSGTTDTYTFPDTPESTEAVLTFTDTPN